jgi:hypothetical protein
MTLTLYLDANTPSSMPPVHIDVGSHALVINYGGHAKNVAST